MQAEGLVLTAWCLAECLLGVHVTSGRAVARICSRQETGASLPPPLPCNQCLKCSLGQGLLLRACYVPAIAAAAYKQQAIDGLGMGTENRVAMLFEEVRGASLVARDMA
jgi:hypothetical protein